MSQNETENTEKYAFFYKRLLHSTHIVRQDTGEEIEIPDCIETLHGYMRDQYESYKDRGKPFFESQESMGRKFKGRDRRWIAARIEVLNRLGLVKSQEQERDSYGHKRFHHTVIPLEEVSDNLLFYGPESISGGPLAEGMLIRTLEKKKPRGTPKKKKAEQPKIEESENGVQQQNHEQPTTVASETAAPAAGKPDGVPPVDAPVDADVPANDDSSLNDQPDNGSNDNGRPAWFRAPFKGNGDLVPEAKAWARSRGATSEEEEKHEIWRALEIINPLFDSQSEPEPQPSAPSTASDEEETEEEEESEEYPF
ncbi:hypothetical protein [Citrobacter sp. CK180]|uniref:DUF6945 domain-containing protein n=1 Tax=Citrobacter sp. CK180 TaxID=2985089 RepID=UPI0025777D0C|nr:hypothetical protein [Citrobacter sp. CK180]MDM3065714.1 hypothetical protein [Citrobacter sp. CK180]